MKKLFFVFTLLTVTAFGDGIIIKGIALVNEKLEHFGEPGIQVHDVMYPGDFEELDSTLSSFLNQVLTKELLQELKKEVILYFRTHDRPLVDVKIPPQDVTDGYLQVVVTVGKLGKVVCEGNQSFKDKTLLDYLELKGGEPLDPKELLKGLRAMNRNPFRHSELIFTPGNELGTTDVRLVTNERFPLRVFAGGDNTGNLATNMARLYSGLNWGNAFFRGHLLTYQFTTSPNPHLFASHTIDYTVPIPKIGHRFYCLGGFTKFDPDMGAVSEDMEGHFTHAGKSGQLGVRYWMPWNGWDLGVGYDWKTSYSLLLFKTKNGGGKTFKSGNSFETTISQFLALFSFQGERWKNKLEGKFQVALSPLEIQKPLTVTEKKLVHSNVSSKYLYCRLSLDDFYFLPRRMGLRFAFEGQLSNADLPVSEKLGIGGYDTVRGYPEREFNADSGAIMSGEWHTPFFSPSLKKWPDQLTLLAFSDFGFGRQHTPLAGDPTIVKLLGMGFGLRYQLSSYVTGRVDWGRRFLDTPLTTGRPSRWHVGIVTSY